MGGRSSQIKGKRGEQSAVNIFKSMGIPARRTAQLQSGLGRQSDVADFAWGPKYEYTAEVKTVAKGYATLYKALGSMDLLVIKMDRRERVYVLSESMARSVLPLLMEVEQ